MKTTTGNMDEDRYWTTYTRKLLLGHKELEECYWATWRKTDTGPHRGKLLQGNMEEHCYWTVGKKTNGGPG